ncbi:hypothetical protein MINS_00950 [Mycolicibacterium insubricum]|nr:histidine kinase [Mycolicibacterium insubricum]BBZ64666.1 hypothetical protein MINS_00950 [Mycolicibacterium insubricum]
MLRTATESAWARFRGRDDLIPPGFSWEFVVAVDGCMAGIMIVSTLQRSVTDLPWSLLACAFALAPLGVFLTFGFKHHAPLAWSSATSATAVFLFATSTPVPSDYVPFALVTMAGAVGALTSPPLSLLALTSSAALLIGAAATHRLDNIALYLPVLGMGWLVGYLMHIQQQLIIRQRDAQQQLAEHAAGDERRRIAREVHDVIAHSLSITLLHLTGARRGLQEDGDVEEAVEALQQAEELGRQAMGDIRRTVGLLDAAPMRAAPEPGVADIGALAAEFRNAGLDVTVATSGPLHRVSAAVGLALYRIAQESLANIAKHAPDSASTLRLEVRRRSVEMTVTNELGVPAGACFPAGGRGLVGMRQRVELLGGRVEIGPVDQHWEVRVSIPLEDTRALGCGA